MEEEKDLTVIEQLVDDLCCATFGPEEGPESVRKDEQKQKEIVKKLYHLMYPEEDFIFKPLNIAPVFKPMTYKASMDCSCDMASLVSADFVKENLASQLMDAVKDNMSIKTFSNPYNMTTTIEATIGIIGGSRL